MQGNRQAGGCSTLPDPPALLFAFSMLTYYSMVRGKEQADSDKRKIPVPVTGMPKKGLRMEETLKATTFKDSNRSFLAMLDEHEIEYNRRIHLGGPMAAGLTIEIVINGGWGAVAVACIAWAAIRKSRRINVTTKNGKVVWLEGYSAKEAEQILSSAQQIGVIDTESDEKV